MVSEARQVFGITASRVVVGVVRMELKERLELRKKKKKEK